ncbi:MAG: hypothetical protein J0H42_32735 [Rhizobiales bacterium]|nr:hypothetical protein [Hyphomicrobiales bacterium]
MTSSIIAHLHFWAADLGFSPMAFGDWGRYANRTNLLSQCGRFLISKEEGARILDEMTSAVGGG